MEVELQSQLAFHLTGRRNGTELRAVEPLALRPALLARYRDLTTLRYDFPVVLVENAPDDSYVQALSGIVDGILREVAQGEDGERVTRHVLRLEQQVRALLAEGTRGSLSALWEAAAGRLGARADPLLADSLARARAVLKVDGELLDCDATLPYRIVKHAWSAVQDQKAQRFRHTIGRLAQKLSDILMADFARSEDGRSAESLKASVGALHADTFDFAALSRVLGKVSAKDALPSTRRERIRALLTVLELQRFYPSSADSSTAVQPYSFVFDSCAGALAAYRERNPELIALARAIAMAELEIAGEFRESKHEAFFEGFGEDGLDPKELALFPDYLVCVNAHKLDAVENSTLMEILSAGLPIKILVQVDDVPSALPNGDGHLGFSMSHLATMAIGLNAVYVVQSCSANLFQFRGRLRAGLSYAGPALFSVFSGAGPAAEGLPTYLIAAAAMESRAFPAFSYDPSAGPDWASRFDLQANPQADLDWPVHSFEYEDEAHQRVTDTVAFTLADFLACDRRYARHLARIPRSRWSENMVPVSKYLAHNASGLSNEVPCLLAVDRDDDTLHKVIVDDKMMREIRRCRDMWHSLQELGGIHNSHAERLLACERNARAEHERSETEATERERSASIAAPTVAATPAPSDAPPEKPSDDAYIETARCTSCNECTKINDKMFSYNENQQAYIANVAAGTYAQLVEAAESCQVAIIHPGKPRDPHEPDLEELTRRAEPFR